MVVSTMVDEMLCSDATNKTLAMLDPAIATQQETPIITHSDDKPLDDSGETMFDILKSD